MEPNARTRFVNGRILTQDPDAPRADTMIVEGERILWVGDAGALPEELAADGGRTVDLGGACVIPGFVDAHMHALMLAGFTGQISALPPAVTSIAELTEAVRAKRAEQGPDA